MKNFYAITVTTIALCLAGCGKEAVSPRSADWYSANTKERAADRAACRTDAPTSEVGKQNCKNAEASEVRDLTGPSRVRIQ